MLVLNVEKAKKVMHYCLGLLESKLSYIGSFKACILQVTIHTNTQTHTHIHVPYIHIHMYTILLRVFYETTVRAVLDH